jgi:hypothetical protein
MMTDEYMIDYRFEEFTEASYERFLDIASKKYKFCSFGEETLSPHILLRHDVDFSAHRAMKMAQIENERSIKSTYLFCPNDPMYNMFSTQILEIIIQIHDLGHDIGLHFDPTVISKPLSLPEIHSQILNLKNFFSTLTKIDPQAISFHLYGAYSNLMPKEQSISGMINAYSDEIMKKYRYISDSNGIWRFDNLFNFLEETQEPFIQILIHPVWWTPEALSPRQRISRTIDGYSNFMNTHYDELIASYNRPNIK